MRVALSYLLLLCLSYLHVATASAGTDGKKDVAPCGQAKVHLDHPTFIVTKAGLLAVELPAGWYRDKTVEDPIYIIKTGQSYKTARTLMYVALQKLEGSLQQAVKNDVQDFQTRCEGLALQNLKPAALLEEGCERQTQMFDCRNKKDSYVDLVTKIAVGDILVNVVLSADSAEDISQTKRDYEYLLMHLTMAVTRTN